MSQLVWLITGCSSGFGEQFVQSIRARGDQVIATGRDLSKLQHLAQEGVTTLQLDLTSSSESIRDTVAAALNVHGRIDVLVNNASFVQIGTIEELDYEDLLAQFDTNVFGTIKVTQALLPHFRQRRSGTMVFISSLSGWIGHPGCGAYAGSKFALEALVESLHDETSSLGLKILLIEPGRFRTKLLTPGNMKLVNSSIPDYLEFFRKQKDALAKEDQAQPGDPVKLVEIILDLVRDEGVAKGREVPFRLALGSDAYSEIRAKCRDRNGAPRGPILGCQKPMGWAIGSPTHPWVGL